jgi:8-oxo-dGTP pyrophosphatase MutT (NUDIX family)
VDFEEVRARLGPHEAIEQDVTGRAAVAAILRARDRNLEILLIRRAERGTDPWSGHMAFPGGRHEPNDASLLETAMRETREELGLDLNEHAQMLGRLDDLRAIGRAQRTGLIIAPFVFGMHRDAVLTPNAEVDEVYWTPIDPMRQGERDATIDYPYQGTTLKFPGFQVADRVVWGLTYRMLQLLFERLQKK